MKLLPYFIDHQQNRSANLIVIFRLLTGHQPFCVSVFAQSSSATPHLMPEQLDQECAAGKQEEHNSQGHATIASDLAEASTREVESFPSNGRTAKQGEATSNMTNGSSEDSDENGNSDDARYSSDASSSEFVLISTDPLAEHTDVPSTNETENGVRPNARTAEARERKRQSRKRARRAAARRKHENTSVYVTGIPSDATERELATHFTKCGILLPNPQTGRPRIKMYTHSDGSLKGDALLTYAMRPSVDNALELLDNAPLRPPHALLRVQEASFEHKRQRADNTPISTTAATGIIQPTTSNPSTKGNVSVRDIVQDALTWDDGPRRSNAPRIVILKNAFSPSDADYKLIRQDMEDGCSVCGDVDKITVFERSPDGVVAIKFASSEAALTCIDVMNGRWYDGRKLDAAFYDGKTDYRYKETDADREERDRKWKQWLEGPIPEVKHTKIGQQTQNGDGNT